MTRLLLVGPLPPPLTGTPVSFEILAEALVESDRVEAVDIVDSSPKWLKQGMRTGWRLPSLREARQAARMLRRFVPMSKRADVVVIFAGNASLITVVPLLLAVCRLRRLPCHFRVFGGSLDGYLTHLSRPMRLVAVLTLRRLDSVIVETELLRAALVEEVAPTRCSLVPGYRPIPRENVRPPQTAHEEPLRLVFVGIIKQSKGVFMLLDAVERFDVGRVSCRFYGEIRSDVRDRFLDRVRDMPAVTYGGVVDWRNIVDAIAQHDCLVLPSTYEGEGHPGVLIEAKMAGVPVIATRFRAIPEVVDDGENGLLFAPDDVDDLVAAIDTMTNPDRRRVLAEASASGRSRFGTEVAAALLLDHILVD